MSSFKTYSVESARPTQSEPIRQPYWKEMVWMALVCFLILVATVLAALAFYALLQVPNGPVRISFTRKDEGSEVATTSVAAESRTLEWTTTRKPTTTSTSVLTGKPVETTKTTSKSTSKITMKSTLTSTSRITAKPTPASTSPSTNPPRNPAEDDVYRLNTSLVPKDYKLIIIPKIPGYKGVREMEDLTFIGQVDVTFDFYEPIQNITLNSVGLKFDKTGCHATVMGNLMRIVRSLSYENVGTDQETVTAHLAQKLYPKHTSVFSLTLFYIGKINTGGKHGFTSFSYKQGNETKIALYTQFEGTYAREVVPCFDEPQYKATWSVTIVHPNGTTALSNSAINSTKRYDANNVITRFDPTSIRMSSYLLAFSIHEFARVQAVGETLTVSAWLRPDVVRLGEYAAQATVKSIDFLSRHFGKSLPMTKLDLIGFKNFGYGGMENWGHIVFGESTMLFDPAISLTNQRKTVFETVAHEVAHLWFGDLVTMKFWNDIWVKEAFATMYESIAAVPINDNLERMEDITAWETLPFALKSEDKSSHPVSYKLQKFYQIDASYDHVVYMKGGSIMLMLRQLMGPDNFQIVMKGYLEQKSLTNVDTMDLLNYFQPSHLPQGFRGPNGPGLDFVDFLSQYILQMGTPRLTMKRSGDTVTITQKADVKSVLPPEYSNPKHGFKWDIPIWYQEGDEDVVKVEWLTREKPLVLKAKAPLVLNSGSYGFYWVDYEESELHSLAAQLKKNHKIYTPRTKARFLYDMFESIMNNNKATRANFEVIDYLFTEEEFLPWAVIYERPSVVERIFAAAPSGSRSYQALAHHVYNNMNHTFISKNYANPSLFFEMTLATEALTKACSTSNSPCLKKAKKFYDEHVKGVCTENDLPSKCVVLAPPFRKRVYCASVMYGDQSNLNLLKRWLAIETHPHEQLYLTEALTCAQKEQPLDDALRMALRLAPADEGVPMSDEQTTALLEALLENPIVSNKYLDFFTDVWDDLKTDNKAALKAISVLHKAVRNEQDLYKLTRLSEERPDMRDLFNTALDVNAIRRQIF